MVFVLMFVVYFRKGGYYFFNSHIISNSIFNIYFKNLILSKIVVKKVDNLDLEVGSNIHFELIKENLHNDSGFDYGGMVVVVPILKRFYYN